MALLEQVVSGMGLFLIGGVRSSDVPHHAMVRAYGKVGSTIGVMSLILATSLVAPAKVWADDLSNAEYLKLEAAQNAANSKSGPRYVPAKVLPVPKTVSKEMQAAIAAPYPMPAWTANHPTNADEWKKIVGEGAAKRIKALPELREKLGVSIEQTKIGGVNAYVLTPKNARTGSRNRVALYFHGGGYVYNPGEAGTYEATLMAGYGGYKVISVDYRMPPDAPYPAAMDDALAVYKELLKKYDHRNIGVFGTSAGGGITLSLVLRAKAEHLPLPGAIAPSTPWADLTEEGGGDSMIANEWVDGTLISYGGYIRHSAQVYANGHDLKDPFLSPIYGDFRGFPPAIITTGTRDLFLSLSALTHRKLRQAGVDAQLHVYEGQSHAQYYVPYAPETKEVFNEIALFFDKHLAK